MAVSFKLKGMDKVLSNLNKQIAKIENRSLKGMIRASAIVRNDMAKTPPKVPVDTRNLEHSYFTVTNKGGNPIGRSPNFKGDDKGKMQLGHEQVLNNSKSLIRGTTPSIMFGFSAYYALFVHENIGANFVGAFDITGKKKDSRREGAGAKFFEVAIQRNEKKMLEVIAKEAKII